MPLIAVKKYRGHELNAPVADADFVDALLNTDHATDIDASPIPGVLTVRRIDAPPVYIKGELADLAPPTPPIPKAK